VSGLGFSPLVRPMKPEQAVRAAKVLFRSADRAYRDLNWHHGEDETVKWFTSNLEKWQSIWIYLMGEQICGVMCLEPGFVDQLFVDVDWQGKGVGSALLDHAKKTLPGGFWLYVFQKNTQAVSFYERHGMTLGKEGVSEQEGEKDAQYHWRP
jgi:ribosomal protein S18 acetylase RimI-like enzyme